MRNKGITIIIIIVITMVIMYYINLLLSLPNGVIIDGFMNIQKELLHADRSIDNIILPEDIRNTIKDYRELDSELPDLLLRSKHLDNTSFYSTIKNKRSHKTNAEELTMLLLEYELIYSETTQEVIGIVLFV